MENTVASLLSQKNTLLCYDSLLCNGVALVFDETLFVRPLPDTEKRAQYIEEERHMREENIRLQRKLQREMERREALCRQLSESESSLEMDDER